ncbi:hypothetical protein [Treponema vincentii]|uniref:hypothetical protein n=1 Tax=Treponema vincentii TaxID=69710 RepID=UPI001E492ADA|nr:hypothetical protein [Treponema vincentii]
MEETLVHYLNNGKSAAAEALLLDPAVIKTERKLVKTAARNRMLSLPFLARRRQHRRSLPVMGNYAAHA